MSFDALQSFPIAVALTVAMIIVGYLRVRIDLRCAGARWYWHLLNNVMAVTFLLVVHTLWRIYYDIEGLGLAVRALMNAIPH